MPSILQTVERRGSWICLCPPKSVELSEGGRLQRALHTLELQAALHEIDFGGRSREYIILAGGGLVVEASGEDGPSCAQFEDDTMAVFTGVLTNYGYLVKRFALGEDIGPDTAAEVEPASCQRSASKALETIEETRQVSEAELLCRMYRALGTRMLTKLKGEFSFLVFNAKTARVLAARDQGGDIGLVQGRTRNGSLLIASGEFLPEGCTGVHDIPPSHYKYGWSSEPQRYCSNASQTLLGAQQASAAAGRALQGINAPVSPRADIRDSECVDFSNEEVVTSSSFAKGKTRRGKRAGRHQKQRVSTDDDSSIEAARRSADGDSLSSSLRPSLDGSRVRNTPVSCHQPHAFHGASLADRTDWWRRPSMTDRTITAGSSLYGSLPSHAVYSAAFQPQAPRQQTGFVVAATSEAPAESEVAEVAADPSSKSDDMVAELRAREACASLVGTLAERVAGIPCNASAVALGDLAEEAELSELSELATTSQKALDLSGDSRPLTRNWTLHDKFEALKDLPPGLLQNLSGPYREEAASLRMLASLLHTSASPLCVTDALSDDMPILWVNRVFEHSTGYTAAELLGRNPRFLQAKPGTKWEPTEASMAIRAALIQGRARGTRILNFHKDGHPMWNDLTIVPLRNAEGVITHHVGMQSFSPVGEVPSGGGARFPVGTVPIAAKGGLSAYFAKSKSCVNLRAAQMV